MSRTLGQSLWGSSRDAVNKRNYPPGQHGASGYKRISDYGKQLQAKQALMLHYNIHATQFCNIYRQAEKKMGDSTANFFAALESRLDAAVYRGSLLPTIFAARQTVSHKHITVNGVMVNKPAYMLKPGDLVQIRERARNMNSVLQAIQSEIGVPDYLSCDKANFSVLFIRAPAFEDIPYSMSVDPSLVVGFYSR